MNLSSNVSETFKGIGRTPQSRSPPSLARVPKEEAQQYLTSNDFRKIESLEEAKANIRAAYFQLVSERNTIYQRREI
jgi:hypothetical protein